MPAQRMQISGKVQGVSFRAETQLRANELGLKGWIRNDADGSVIMHVEGEEGSIRSLEEWCQSGPSAATVAEMHNEIVEEEGYETFEILK